MRYAVDLMSTRRSLPLLLTLLLAILSFATAQVPTGPAGMTGVDPEALADDAVQAWLATDVVSLSELGAMDAEAVCEALPALFAAPPPPSGTDVAIEDRQARDTGDANRLRFTYAAEVPPNRLEVVEVLLTRDGDAWRVEGVGFQIDVGSGRSWLTTPQAGLVMVLFTLAFVFGLARRSFLQRWLREGAAAIREHRRLVTWTMLLGWSVVVAGFWTGSQLPDACETAVVTILGSTLDSVGATAALASGDVAQTAAVIYYQNFFVVTLTVLLGSAVLLGVPAYLLASASFFAQTTAFGVLGLGSGWGLIAIVVLMILEFTAYFLVVSGGGMLVATLVRGGLTALGTGYRKLFSVISWSALLLLIGAWYEALILLAF